MECPVLQPVNSKVVFFTIVHCIGARRVSLTNDLDHSSKLTSLILADPHVSPGQINILCCCRYFAVVSRNGVGMMGATRQIRQACNTLLTFT